MISLKTIFLPVLMAILSSPIQQNLKMILCLLPIALLALPTKHVFPVEGQPFIEILDQRMKIDKNDVFDVELGFASQTQKSEIANLNIIDSLYMSIVITPNGDKQLLIFFEKDNSYQIGGIQISEGGELDLGQVEDLRIPTQTNNCSGFTAFQDQLIFVCANYTNYTIDIVLASQKGLQQVPISIPITAQTKIDFEIIPQAQAMIILTSEINSSTIWAMNLTNGQLQKAQELPAQILQFDINKNTGIVLILLENTFIMQLGQNPIQIPGEFEQFTSYFDVVDFSFRIALVSRDEVTFLYIDLKQEEVSYDREDKAFEKNQITSSNSQIFLNDDYLIVTNDVAVFVYEYKGDIKLKYQIPTKQPNKAIFLDDEDLIILLNKDNTVQTISIDKDLVVFAKQVKAGAKGQFNLSTIDSKNPQNIQYQYTTLKKNDFSIQTLSNQSFSESTNFPFIIIREKDIFFGPNITINRTENIPKTHKDLTRSKVSRIQSNITLNKQFIIYDQDLQQYLSATLQNSSIQFSLMKLDLSTQNLKVQNITQFKQTKDVQDVQFLKQSDGQYLVFACSNSDIQYYKIFTDEKSFKQSQSLSTIDIGHEGRISSLQLVPSDLWLKVLVNNEQIHILQLEDDEYHFGGKFGLVGEIQIIQSDKDYNDVLYLTINDTLYLLSLQGDGVDLIYVHKLDLDDVEQTQIGFMKEGIFLFEQSREEQQLSFIPRQSQKQIQVNRIPSSIAQTFSPSSVFAYTQKFFYNVQKVQGNQELVVYEVQPSSFNTIYQSIYFKSTIKQLSCSTNSLEQYDLCIVVFDTGLSEQVIIMHEQIIVLLNIELFNAQQKNQTLLGNQTYKKCETPQSIYDTFSSELTIICSNNSYIYDLKTQTDKDSGSTNGTKQITLSAFNQKGAVNSSVGLNFISLSSSSSDEGTTTKSSSGSSAVTVIIILLVLAIFVAGGILFYLRRKSLLLRQSNVLPEDNPKAELHSGQEVTGV